MQSGIPYGMGFVKNAYVGRNASGYDMESIKSRPLPHVPFDYYFYVELVGDPTADETAALLRELDHTCRTVRLLGVYTK